MWQHCDSGYIDRIRAHLESNPRHYTAKTFPWERARELLYLMDQGDVFDGAVKHRRLNSRLLRNRLGWRHATKIIKELSLAGVVIELDGAVQYQHRSRTYGLVLKYATGRIEKTPLTDRHLINKRMDAVGYKEGLVDRVLLPILQANAPHFTVELDAYRLLAGRAFQDDGERYTDDERAQQVRFAEDLNGGDMRFTGDRQGRVYHQGTSLLRDGRKLLVRLDGGLTREVDIKTSHPRFLLAIAQNDPTVAPWELAKWKLWLSGDIYARFARAFAEHWGEPLSGQGRQAQRAAGKHALIELVFNGDPEQVYTKRANAVFERHFPTLHAFICRVKAGDNGRLARKLMQAESAFMKKYMLALHGEKIVFLPIHDAVIVSRHDNARANRILSCMLAENGLAYVNHWEKHKRRSQVPAISCWYGNEEKALGLFPLFSPFNINVAPEFVLNSKELCTGPPLAA